MKAVAQAEGGMADSEAGDLFPERNVVDMAALAGPQQAGCAERRRRLGDALSAEGLGGAVLTRPLHLTYLFGLRGWRSVPAAGFVAADGTGVLAVGESAAHVAFDGDVVRFADSYFATSAESRRASALAVLDAHARQAGRTGSDDAGSGASPVTALVTAMRRRKAEDEIAILTAAVRANEAGYRALAAQVRPGLLETEALALFQAAVTIAGGDAAGELGNDFRGGAPGGRPRPVPLVAGDLLPIDAGAVVGGYHSDMCRTFAVSGTRSPDQDRAFGLVAEALDRAEALVRPGVRCGDAYAEIVGFLNSRHPDWRFDHHLGHGFGLEPVEAPFINAGSSHVFEVGDTITLEPGLYGGDLRAGVRLEQDYVVEADGLRRLPTLPLDLDSEARG